ncbi:MAG: hypothetical protein LBV69_09420 [Bacteroidales bacterium]|jgi:hypothetical protein|nr:hypothetical protein [Bacteroidales bacterium]
MNKNVFRPRESKLKNIRNLLQKKLLVVFFCYFNACRDFFVSLIEKEKNNNKNYIIIQKIKHKFVEKFKDYVKKYINKIKRKIDVWELCKTNLGYTCLPVIYGLSFVG